MDDTYLGKRAFTDENGDNVAFLTMYYRDIYEYPLSAIIEKIIPLDTQSVQFTTYVPVEVTENPNECCIRFSFDGTKYCLNLS
jgi:hypothetical protein